MTRGCQRLCVKLRRSSIAGREQNLPTTLVIAKHLHRIIYFSFDQVRAYLLVHSARKIHTPGRDGDRFSISLKYSGVVGSASTCWSYRPDRSGWILRGVWRLVTVLVVDERCPRSSWPLGRIVNVHESRHEGLVRSFTVTTGASLLERPINRTVLLESIRDIISELNHLLSVWEHYSLISLCCFNPLSRCFAFRGRDEDLKHCVI